jgi:hypothetical protein
LELLLIKKRLIFLFLLSRNKSAGVLVGKSVVCKFKTFEVLASVKVKILVKGRIVDYPNGLSRAKPLKGE